MQTVHMRNASCMQAPSGTSEVSGPADVAEGAKYQEAGIIPAGRVSTDVPATSMMQVY